MAEISLCMIVKNEEDVLGRCLESARQAVDEIVIVDTGSTDRTKEIALAFTDKVYDFPWIDDFAAARNFAFSKGTKEYLMWLDADDILLPGDAEALQAFKQSLTADIAMLQYNVGFDAAGNVTLAYERERIMRRERDYRWVGAIHEVIIPVGNVVHSPIAITHRKMKHNEPGRNLRIFEKLVARGEELDPRQQFYFARELYYNSRYYEAIAMFSQFLDGGKGWIENVRSACVDLSKAYLAVSDEKNALRALLRGLEYGAPWAELCCELGGRFLTREQLEAAVFWYETAASLKPEPVAGGFVNPDHFGYIPNMQLCVCYWRLNDREKAVEANRRAGTFKPEDPNYLRNVAFFSTSSAGGNDPQ